MIITPINAQLDLFKKVLYKAKDISNLKEVFRDSKHAGFLRNRAEELCSVINKFKYDQKSRNPEKLHRALYINLPGMLKNLFALYNGKKEELSKDLPEVIKNFEDKKNFSVKDTIMDLANAIRGSHLNELGNNISQLGDNLAKRVQKLFSGISTRFDKDEDKSNKRYISLQAITYLLSNTLNKEALSEVLGSLKYSLGELNKELG